MNFLADNNTLSIFHNIFTFFGTINPDGIVTGFDGEILKKLNLTREFFVGRKFSNMSYWQTSKSNFEKFESVIAKAAVKNVKSTFDFALNETEKISVEIFFQPIPGRENITEYIFFSARNISSREIDSKRKLGDDKFFEPQTAGIYEFESKAGSDAEEANRIKDSFIAVVSHELRTPLNTILGWTKILLTREINEDARKHALETIEKSARLQAKLIEDLVDAARISSSQLQLELHSTNLFDVLKSVYNLQKATAEAKNVSLELISDKEVIQISGDATRLQQIFTNLISNAVKSTKAEENIKIIVQTGEHEVKVLVTDNGRGINHEILPFVFRQFQSGNEKTPFNQAGLGLELSIVKILVEKHNGKVYAESEGVDCGSTFTVVLPLSKEEHKSNADIDVI